MNMDKILNKFRKDFSKSVMEMGNEEFTDLLEEMGYKVFKEIRKGENVYE